MRVIDEKCRKLSLITSALMLTFILGSPATSLAQAKVKATAQNAESATACAATPNQQESAGQCGKIKVDDIGPAAATTLYNNLGKGKTLFDPTGGFPVSGPSSSAGVQGVGFPFTPSASIYLEGLELPLWWRSGLNSVYVCLYADVDGLPGEIVECVIVYNLWPFGYGLYPNCFWDLPRPIYSWPCICWDVIPWEPYYLTEGVRYWIVVYPDPNEPDFWGGWYYNYEHTEGQIAVYNGSSWQAESAILPAAALYGSPKK